MGSRAAAGHRVQGGCRVFDALVKFMMSLVIVGVVTYVGVAVMAQVDRAQSQEIVVTAPATVATAQTVVTTIATTVPTTVPTAAPVAAAPPPDTATVNETVSDAFGWIPIIIITMVALMTFTLLFGLFGGGSSSPSPAPARPAPATVKAPGPTLDDLVRRDPEIVGLLEDAATHDAELAAVKEERRQHIASLPWTKRARFWLRRRSTTEPA